MRAASTTERTETILDMLRGANCKTELVMERWNGSIWQTVGDLDGAKGVNWSIGGRRTKYANVALIPLASTIDFDVLNIGGKYSEGSGEPEENFFDLDTKVRIKAGYKLNALSTEDLEGIELSDIQAVYNYYTRYNDAATDYIGSDIGNTGGNALNHFRDLFMSGGGMYSNTEFLSPAGYVVFTFDNEGNNFRNISGFRVTIGGDAGIAHTGKILWRSVSNLTTAALFQNTIESWNVVGATVTGENETTLDHLSKRYFQVAVILDGIAWSDDFRVTNVEIDFSSYVEWVYHSVFYLDSPSYTDPGQPTKPKVLCSGRDAWKRAIDTEINLPNLSGGVALDDLIRDICDEIGIAYTDDSIADLSDFSNRVLATGLGEPKKADEIFEWIMQILNQTGFNYRMYLEYDAEEEDNVLFVQPIPADYITDFVFNHANYKSIGERRKNFDRLMKRVTVFSASGTSNVDVTLDTDTFTTAGTCTLSWSGDAEYKRYRVVVNSGDPTITLDQVNPTSLVFTITGTFSVTITALGSKWTSAPTYEGEFISHANMIGNRGGTIKMENKLLVSDAEAGAIAKGHIEKFGNPVYEANNVRHPYLNLLLEINDSVMIYSLWTFIDSIFFITKINFHWDYNRNPGDSTSYNLDDAGIKFSDISDFIYDEQEEYDVGFFYDMGIADPTATDAEVDAASEAIMAYDVGEA